MRIETSKITITILAFATVIMASELKAQGSYFNAGFGYGIPSADWLGTTQANGAEENMYGSYGKGLTVGVNTGYMVNENIGFDLGLWYVAGSTYEFRKQDFTGDRLLKVSGHTTRIMPAVKITGRKEHRPYAKFGFILGITNEINIDETLTTLTGTTYPNHEFTGGTSQGWMGAFGIDFSGNKNASVFLEVNFCYQVFKPALQTINIEGQNPQKFHLLDKPNASALDERLRPSFPFSAINITAGIKFSSLLKDKNAPAPADK
jgi:hypothetical protein